jgi:hypothetical protein
VCFRVWVFLLEGFSLGNCVVNGLLFISFVCNYLLVFLHILLSWISVGSVFHTSTSFHLVSKLDHLRSKVLGTRFFLSNLGLSGILHRLKSCCKEMESISRLEMEKFNGTNFDLWKIKMEDLLIDQDLWVAVSGTKHIGMKYEEWEDRYMTLFCYFPDSWTPYL